MIISLPRSEIRLVETRGQQKMSLYDSVTDRYEGMDEINRIENNGIKKLQIQNNGIKNLQIQNNGKKIQNREK